MPDYNKKLRENLEMYASLMEEAAEVIKAIPPNVSKEIGHRFFLMDELQGAAIMARKDTTPNIEVQGRPR